MIKAAYPTTGIVAFVMFVIVYCKPPKKSYKNIKRAHPTGRALFYLSYRNYSCYFQLPSKFEFAFKSLLGISHTIRISSAVLDNVV